MTSNEMELHASLAECGVPPTIDGVFAFEAALTISYNLLKTWWPGTELNRRRQPFQGCALPPELPGHVLGRPCKRGSQWAVLDTLIVAGVCGAGNQKRGKRAERTRL